MKHHKKSNNGVFSRKQKKASRHMVKMKRLFRDQFTRNPTTLNFNLSKKIGLKSNLFLKFVDLLFPNKKIV